MKRKYRYMLLAMCAILMVGCQKDMKGVFTAVIENYQPLDGKMYMGDNRYAYWHEGDELMINGMRATIDLSTDVATVKGVAAEDGGFYTAVYPAKSWVNNGCVKFPQYQEYREALNAKGDMVQVIDAPMVAQTVATVNENGEMNELNFKNVGSLMKVTFKNPESTDIEVKNIELSCTSSLLYGNVRYHYDGNELSVESTIDGGGNTISLLLPENKGKILGSKEMSYYMVVPSMGDNIKFKVKVYYIKNGSRKIWKSNNESNEVILERGKMFAMNLSSVPSTIEDVTCFGTVDDPYLIDSKEDLNMIHTMCTHNSTAGVYFKQTADITLDNNWTGIGEISAVLSQWGPIQPFKGIYDGDGHTITIGTESSPGRNGLFNVISDGAVVKDVNMNVHLRMNDQFRNRTSINEDAIIDDIYLTRGGLTKYIFGTEQVIVENCSVIGKIKTEYGDYSRNIGGLCGRYANSNKYSVIRNCKSEVNIESNNNTQNFVNHNRVMMGGIVGMVQLGANLTIEDCRNSGIINSTSYDNDHLRPDRPYGHILTQDDYVISSGGIVGGCGSLNNINNGGGVWSGYYGNLKINRCINAAMVKGDFVGGVLGANLAQGGYQPCTESIQILNCASHGDLYCHLSYDFIGGIVGYSEFSQSPLLTLKIENSYSDCNYGHSKYGNSGGIVGNIEDYWPLTLSHLYVSQIGYSPDNAIVFYCTSRCMQSMQRDHVYYPSNQNSGIYGFFTQFSDFNVLKNNLNESPNAGYESWIIRDNGHPGFAFEDIPWNN